MLDMRLDLCSHTYDRLSKSIKNIEDVHFAIVKSYLRAVGQEHGLILNFAKPTLEIKRVICRNLLGSHEAMK